VMKAGKMVKKTGHHWENYWETKKDRRRVTGSEVARCFTRRRFQRWLEGHVIIRSITWSITRLSRRKSDGFVLFVFLAFLILFVGLFIDLVLE
jgi:hypothetical protein